MRVEEITRPILFSLLLGLVLFIGILLILKNPRRAGLAATVVLLLLLSYGQLYSGLKAIGVSGLVVRHRYLIPGLVLAGVFVGFGIHRMRSSASWARGANIVDVMVLVGKVRLQRWLP